MESRKIRDTIILLPGEAPDDLEPVSAIPRDKASVADVQIVGDIWSRTKITDVNVARSWFLSANLDATEFSGATLDRCVFQGSSLIGTRLTDVSLKNVIFENCRLDYATFSTVRASGPVAFLGCSLSETEFHQCKLTVAVFDGCKLNSTELDACDMRGADLRGNDISRLIGAVTSLRGATLAHTQLADLATMTARSLGLKVTD